MDSFKYVRCPSSENQETARDAKYAKEYVITFRDLSCSARVRPTRCSGLGATESKTILHDLSGIFRPGLNVIMGPTGSGKTTLLDILANRKDPKLVAGNVLLNGKRIPKNFRHFSGHVVQYDLLIPTATVREALWFCANLRLPTSVSYDHKAEKIQRILKEVGLSGCADTVIGNEMIRGISGGEKKRASIATELILEPRILLIDEPTTGLDAATAWSVVMLLKRLGDHGRTVICSIHQPRYSIYKMFDTVTLLSFGHMVYHGQAQTVLKYFENLGYVCETKDNPADFYLDVLNGRHEIADSGAPSNTHFSQDELVQMTKYLEECFNRSNIKKELYAELGQIETNAVERVYGETRETYATGFLHQTKVLIERSGRNMVRHPRLLLSNILFDVTLCIIVGLTYLQVPDTPDKGVQDRLGVLYLLAVYILMEAAVVAGIFHQEQVITAHEHASGYYSILSYFLSKVMADLLPLRTVQSIMYTALTYWMVGLRAETYVVLMFLLTTTLSGYAAAGAALFISSSASERIGGIALRLTIICSINFSGLLVNLDQMSDWLSWLQYLSVPRYTLVALAINEFRGVNFTRCSDATEVSSAPNYSKFDTTYVNGRLCYTLKGETILHDTLAIGTPAGDITNWDLWQNIVALAVVTLILYTLTYMQLARRKMYK